MPPDDVAMLRAQIGLAIKDARRRAGLPNQKALGDLVGIAQTTVSRWERGAPDGVLTLDDVIALEDALDLPRGVLLTEAGYVPPSTDPMVLIQRDPTISDDRREYLLELYELSRYRKAAEENDADTSPSNDTNESSRSSRRATS